MSNHTREELLQMSKAELINVIKENHAEILENNRVIQSANAQLRKQMIEIQCELAKQKVFTLLDAHIKAQRYAEELAQRKARIR